MNQQPAASQKSSLPPRSPSPHPAPRLPFALLWLAFFALYAATTARDVLPADSGEFQLAAATWDILHPPGYPLYTMIGALWVRLAPLGNVAFRLNLLSAILAATTLLLVAKTVRLWTETWGLAPRAALTGGLAAAGLLGSSPTFWAQATTANIRMPTLLFGAWGFLALAQYDRELRDGGDGSRALVSLAAALGLGVGHHPSLAFVAIGWALYLLLRDPSLLWQPRRWWKAVPVAALAWGLPQLYLPLRGAAIEGLQLAPPGLNTWAGFWHHVLAQGFAGDMFAFANPTDLALRLPLIGPLFRFQFPPVALLAVSAAWIWLLLRQRQAALALGTAWLVHTFVTLTYRAPQTVEYLMPAYLPLVIVFGAGMAQLLAACGRLKPRQRDVPAIAVLALLALRVAGLTPDFVTLAADTSIRERVEPLLEQAPPDARILADWHWATPLWVLQRTEGLGAGAEIVYVYPRADQEYEQVWRTWAEETGDRPLFTTHAYEWSGWTAAPVGGGYRLYRRPLTALPTELGFTPLQAELGPLRLLGYRVVGAPEPGRDLEVQLAWQASGSQDPAPSFTVRLFDAQGNFLLNADRWLGSDTAAGEVRFTGLTLALPVDRCTPMFRLTASVYTVTEGAFTTLGEVSLAELAATCIFPTLPTEHVQPGVVLWAGPLLRGMDYHVDGNKATAYLHWCGPGQALIVHSGEEQALVEPLDFGRCQTVRLSTPVGQRPALQVSRPDGSPARLVSLALPAPESGQRYLPFGDTAVLVGAQTAERGGFFVVDLTWRATRPLVDDYAVSVRLKDTAGTLLGMHDMQPALSDIPTLKWVVNGARVLDPHPFDPPETPPTTVTVTLYERFRLTPVAQPATFGIGR